MSFSRTLRFATSLIFIGLGQALSASPGIADRSDDAEAARLYERADAYVRNINEGDYSYNYLQFYWKRSQSNLDRILRVYPRTDLARQLQAGERRIGPFETGYFRDRVLPRVEVKKLGAYDAVNCAIFLYNLDQQRWDSERLAALDSILEVLCRQQRWKEALIFPVRDEDTARKTLVIYSVAAHFGQTKIMEQIRADAPDSMLPALAACDAEGIIYLGKPRTELDKLFEENSADSVRLAALEAMVTRELLIRNPPEELNESTKAVGGTHVSMLNLGVRDDVRAIAKAYFPQGSKAAALAVRRLEAGAGEEPPSNDTPTITAEYLRFLIRKGSVEEAERVASRSPKAAAMNVRLAQIRLLEEYGFSERAQAVIKALRLVPADLERAESALFEGRMESRSKRLTVQPETFSSLRIQDPCRLAQSIMAWSLTPNRQLRGAAPWDSVVRKYLPGFENLPLPESDDVAKASSILKPY